LLEPELEEFEEHATSKDVAARRAASRATSLRCRVAVNRFTAILSFARESLGSIIFPLIS
jgi:hypothetical protein